ncbi:MAG: hypothetical protein KBD17_02485 [Candidatus Pacebacteria bacterium]|nr:hypothetical protein [Candidatus Paceibacterota bacterium]
MYQDETEKELEENGFRITSGGDDEDSDMPLAPLGEDEDPLEFGLDEEDPDQDH